MAQLSFQGLDGIADQLSRMADAGEQVKEAMLDAGAQVCVNAWKNTAIAHGHVKNGDMVKSIRAKKAGKDAREIYPMGTNRRGVRNAEIAFILHYGTHGNRIKGDGWCDEAAALAEAEAVPLMREMFEEFVTTGRIPFRDIPKVEPTIGGNAASKSAPKTQKNYFINPNNYWYKQSMKAQNKRRR